MGFGGLGLRVERELFRRWPNHHFLLPFPPDPEAAAAVGTVANVTVLPKGVRPLDLMPHCDRLIGKPGFSTFSEALSTGLGLHVVERSGFAEAIALMDGLRRHGSHRILSRTEFDRGAWQLDQPLHRPESAALETDGALTAALAIQGLLE